MDNVSPQTNEQREDSAPLLKPCPFCGGNAAFSRGEKSGIAYWYAECFDCAAATDFGVTKENASEFWNMRHPLL